jgi:integrase
LLAAIDRNAVAARLSEVAAENGPIASNRVRASLSTFFAWGIGEGLIDWNPVIGTNRNDEVERDRVLSDAELKEIWAGLEDDDYGDIVKLLVLTAQRREEIGGLRWSEVDFERGDIVLFGAKAKTRKFVVMPDARTKNKFEHDVPMADLVVAILKERKRIADRDLVFGQGEGGYQGWSNSKLALDGRVSEARKKAQGRKWKAMPEWHLHDLRRTAATGMGEKLGMLPHVVEAVINHVSGTKSGVAGVYNRARYTREKRQALEAWATHVLNVVSDQESNVIPLRLAAAVL